MNLNQMLVPPEVLKSILVCPLCKGELTFEPRVIQCQICGEKYPQTNPVYFDFFKEEHLLRSDTINWKQRDAGLAEFIKNFDEAQWLNIFPIYERIFEIFGDISGFVLDIGGGDGSVRHWIKGASYYISLDVDPDWVLKDRYPFTHEKQPIAKTKPTFIKGTGEFLPFQDNSFDSVICVSTLNHTCNPKQVIGEAYRILRKKGKFFLTVEDVFPNQEKKTLFRKFFKLIKAIFLKNSSDSFNDALMGYKEPTFYLKFTEDEVKSMLSGKFRIEISDITSLQMVIRARKI